MKPVMEGIREKMEVYRPLVSLDSVIANKTLETPSLKVSFAGRPKIELKDKSRAGVEMFSLLSQLYSTGGFEKLDYLVNSIEKDHPLYESKENFLKELGSSRKSLEQLLVQRFLENGRFATYALSTDEIGFLEDISLIASRYRMHVSVFLTSGSGTHTLSVLPDGTLNEERIRKLPEDLQKVVGRVYNTRPEALEKKEMPLWMKVGAVIGGAAILGGVALGALYINNQNQKKEQRIKQLETVMPRSKGMGFDDKYQKLAVDSFYNQTVLDFGRVYNIDPSLAEHDLQVSGSFGRMPTLSLGKTNSSLLAEIHRNSLQDPRKNTDANTQTEQTAELCLDLNLAGKSLGTPTVHGLGNLSISYRSGLPRFDRIDLWRLTNATQLSGDIVDFSPIILKDVDGNSYVIQSENPARDHWMIANLLKERPEIAGQVQKFEWINRMIQQGGWCIFDNQYGTSFYDGRVYSPADAAVWQVILPFHDYMDDLPAKLVRDGIGVIFPYHDSSLLRSYMADKTNRTVALLYLADLPSQTVDKDTKQVVSGISGMKKYTEQLPKEYDEIVFAKNDPTIISYPAFSGTKHDWAMLYYQQWLNDRAGHGLPNTVEQFKKTDDVLASWKHWDLVKFIYGYERFKSGDWGGEWEMYRHGLPLAFKALGIPAGVAEHGANFGINSDSYLVGQGAPGSEWGVTLPDSTILQLRQTFPQYEIITDYANRISLFSLPDGLTKDSSGVTWIATVISNGDKPIYLWKKR